MTDQVTDSGKMIAELWARTQIQNALCDYALGLDARDPDRWLAAFHEDGVFDCDFPRGVMRGHAEILAWAEDVWTFKSTSHQTTNHRIDFTSLTEATGLGHAIGLFCLADGTITVGSARYTDRYSLRGDDWRIEHRKTAVVMIAGFPEAQLMVLFGQDVGGSTSEH